MKYKLARLFSWSKEHHSKYESRNFSQGNQNLCVLPAGGRLGGGDSLAFVGRASPGGGASRGRGREEKIHHLGHARISARGNLRVRDDEELLAASRLLAERKQELERRSLHDSL